MDEFTPYNHKIGYNICSIAGNSLGRKFSDETKKKMSEATKGKRMGKTNTNVSGICLCCQGKRKSASGFIWKYS